MKYRKLRIAFSAFCAIVSLLAIAFWARSYRMNEAFAIRAAGTKFHVQSLLGRVIFGRSSNSVSFRQPVTDDLRKVVHQRENFLGFEYHRAPTSDPLNDLISVSSPHWFAVTAFAILTTLPWVTRLKLHFSLRALLVAITTIGVALGLIYAASRL